MCKCPHYSPVSRLCACRSCCALTILSGSFALLPFPPFTLSLIQTHNQEIWVSPPLLKLALGNLIPYTKPEMPKVPTRRNVHTSAPTNTDKHDKHSDKLTVMWMWGSPGFVLPAPSSVSGIVRIAIGIGSLLIRDLLCRSQSLFDAAKGEWDPLFPPFLQSKHPHAGSSNPTSPWGLHCIPSLLQYLSQPSKPAGVHICLGATAFACLHL